VKSSVEASFRITVIIPTYNRWNEARLCIDSLRKGSYSDVQICLIEDGCTDGTAENCQKEFPEVEMIHGDGNLWWGGAINKGIQYAIENKADAVILLNDDNRVEKDTIRLLVDAYRAFDGKAVVCAHVRRIGEEAGWYGQPPLWHPDHRTWVPPEDQIYKIYHPPGGQGVMIPVKCLTDAGAMDVHSFPHYWADHDLHYRVMKRGYPYFVVREALVWDLPNAEQNRGGLPGSPGWIMWYLFSHSSAMNVVGVHRILFRHHPFWFYIRHFAGFLSSILPDVMIAAVHHSITGRYGGLKALKSLKRIFNR
jgi:GT2 family glycosyltransferase